MSVGARPHSTPRARGVTDGASFQIVQQIGRGAFDIHLSVPLALEYESVLCRHETALGLSREQILRFVNYLCAVAHLHDGHFL